MRAPKWKVKKQLRGGWLAHRETCPSKDHFCWRGLFGFIPGCRMFDSFEPSLQHAVNGAKQDAVMHYMDSVPLYGAKLH